MGDPSELKLLLLPNCLVAGNPARYKAVMLPPDLAERGSMAVILIAAAIIWGSLPYALRDVMLRFF
jgi:hypothetical protein